MRASDDVTISVVSTDSRIEILDGKEFHTQTAPNGWAMSGAWSTWVKYVGPEYESVEVDVDDTNHVNFSYKVTMYDKTNEKVLSSADATSFISGNLATVAGARYVVEVSAKIDYLVNGERTSTNTLADNVDDSKQTIKTFRVEGYSDTKNAGTGKYDESTWVIDDQKTLERIVDFLDKAPVYVDKDTVNELVFYVNGNTITAKWEKNPSKKIVNGTPASETPVYDELDTNHDGVVSCDEAHGEGWVWNEDKKACVYTGSTTSTVIVNTATK